MYIINIYVYAQHYSVCLQFISIVRVAAATLKLSQRGLQCISDYYSPRRLSYIFSPSCPFSFGATSKYNKDETIASRE